MLVGQTYKITRAGCPPQLVWEQIFWRGELVFYGRCVEKIFFLGN